MIAFPTTAATATRPRQAKRPAGAPARKPVYLNGAERLRVRANGEALAIARPRGDIARLPVSRISRIVASRLVDWDAEALTLCLMSGIPIIFLDSHGNPAGICQPRQARADSLEELIESAMNLATWPQRHENWMLHRRSIIVAEWRKRRERRGDEAWVREWQDYQRDYVHKNQLPQSVTPELSGWLLGVVAQELQARGLNTRYWGCQPEPFDLAGDLVTLLHAELHFHGERMLEAANGDLQARLRLFDGWTREHDAIVERHLFDLRKNLTQYLMPGAARWR